MKMKKIIVTGMAFLTVMTVFAGCGSAGKEETNTAEEASTAGENENQEVSISSGENLAIPVSELTGSAEFYPVNVDGTEMEVIAVKTSDGTIRTAFNTCQICYDSGDGYYKQEGDKLVCQNCGNSFTMDQVGESAGGCNPWPILESDRTLADDEIQISYDFLKDSADIFANWKGAYQSYRDFAFKEESFPFYLQFTRKNRKDPYGIKSYSFFMYKQSKRTPFAV